MDALFLLLTGCLAALSLGLISLCSSLLESKP